MAFADDPDLLWQQISAHVEAFAAAHEASAVSAVGGGPVCGLLRGGYDTCVMTRGVSGGLDASDAPGVQETQRGSAVQGDSVVVPSPIRHPIGMAETGKRSHGSAQRCHCDYPEMPCEASGGMLPLGKHRVKSPETKLGVPPCVARLAGKKERRQ